MTIVESERRLQTQKGFHEKRKNSDKFTRGYPGKKKKKKEEEGQPQAF